MVRKGMTVGRRVGLALGLTGVAGLILWGTAIPAGWAVALGAEPAALAGVLGLKVLLSSFVLGWVGAAVAWVGACLLTLPCGWCRSCSSAGRGWACSPPLPRGGRPRAGARVPVGAADRAPGDPGTDRGLLRPGRVRELLNIIHVVSNRGNVSRRNRRSRELLGWPDRQSLQLSAYVHPEDTDHFKDLLKVLFERGDPGERIRFRSEGGGWCPSRSRAGGSPARWRCWRPRTGPRFRPWSTSSGSRRPATGSSSRTGSTPWTSGSSSGTSGSGFCGRTGRWRTSSGSTATA